MRKRISVIALLLIPPVLGGCATQGNQAELLGAGGGAAAGALLGQAIGHDTKSTLIGAAIGAAIGWGAVKLMEYKSAPVRTADEDVKIFGLTARTDSPVVKIQRGTCSPKEVHPGDKVTINTDYSLQLPSGAQKADVTESLILKKDGKKLTDLPPKNLRYGSGGYLSEAVISIPQDAQPGTYVIEHRVQAGSTYDVDESVFVVQS